MGDRWTLELLLTAAPWISGNRTLEDKYLSTYVGAIEMLLKGCTACYDLTVEFPQPTPEGLGACAKAYADAGMRAVLAPMVANITFYEAIPGLMDVLPARAAEGGRAAAACARRGEPRGHAPVAARLAFDREQVRPAVAPTIPHHCSDEFMRECAQLAREFDVGLHTHVQESKAQVIVGLKNYGKTPTAHLQDSGLLGPDFVAAHGVWLDDDDIKRLGRPRRLGGAQSRQQHAARQRHRRVSGPCWRASSTSASAPTAPPAATIRTCTSPCVSLPMVSNAKGPDNDRWLASEEILEAATDGSARALGFGDRSAGSPRATRPISFSSTSTTSTGSPATTRPTSWSTPRTAAPCIQ